MVAFWGSLLRSCFLATNGLGLRGIQNKSLQSFRSSSKVTWHPTQLSFPLDVEKEHSYKLPMVNRDGLGSGEREKEGEEILSSSILSFSHFKTALSDEFLFENNFNGN